MPPAISPRLTALLALLLAAGVMLGLAYCTGGSEPRKEAKAAKKEVAAVTKSAQISRETAERVDKQGAEVRQQAARAKEVIDEVIRTGLSDADLYVMREADKAHAATVRARCRVQSTSECDAVSEAP